MNESPQHAHDCNRCIFLGRRGAVDLYICPTEPTVIARRSSEGDDYSSGLLFQNLPDIAEATRRAVSAGYLIPNGNDTLGRPQWKATDKAKNRPEPGR